MDQCIKEQSPSSLDDKIHDHQQVKAFENRMFEMVRNDFGSNVTHWQRWSDGCGAQFKSKFVNSDLLKAKESFQLENASFSYLLTYLHSDRTSFYGLRLIKVEGPKLWNALPKSIRSITSIKPFITNLKNYMVKKYI